LVGFVGVTFFLLWRNVIDYGGNPFHNFNDRSIWLDGWQDTREQQTSPNPLGLHLLEVDTTRLIAGRRIDLTFRHAAGDAWVGRDFAIRITAPAGGS